MCNKQYAPYAQYLIFDSVKVCDARSYLSAWKFKINVILFLFMWKIRAVITKFWRKCLQIQLFLDQISFLPLYSTQLRHLPFLLNGSVYLMALIYDGSVDSLVKDCMK